MSFNRGNFFSALAGLIAGALMIGALPSLAANGDGMLVGEKNNATRATKLISRGGLVLKVGVAGNPALTIDVVPGTPPLQVNSAVKVTDLNADLLDGQHSSAFLGATAQAGDSDTLDSLHANQLIRVAYGETSNAPDTDGVAVSATITAPVAGWLVMSGGVDVNFGGFNSPDRFVCMLKIDGSEVLFSSRQSAVQYIDASHADNGDENCETSAAKPITAGQHTVSLDMWDLDTVSLGNATVWALFVPFDGTGARP